MLLLSCSNLSRGYDATPLFEHVSFEIHAGERIGFVGPNGAGKTTLLRVASGLLSPMSGRMTMDGKVTEFPIPSYDSQPRAMVTHPDGSIWFVETSTNALGRIDKNGNIT